jgi:hypothetical protein
MVRLPIALSILAITFLLTLASGVNGALAAQPQPKQLAAFFVHRKKMDLGAVRALRSFFGV